MGERRGPVSAPGRSDALAEWLALKDKALDVRAKNRFVVSAKAAPGVFLSRLARRIRTLAIA